MELRRYDDSDKLTNCRLQQRWSRVVEDGPIEYEWRDVPIVWHPGGRDPAAVLANNGGRK